MLAQVGCVSSGILASINIDKTVLEDGELLLQLVSELDEVAELGP